MIELARSSGVPVWSEIELAWRFLRGKLVAITGSNGKTTTTSLVSHILRTAGINTLTGGNIGIPLLSLVESTTDSTITVAEVSSFQLETIEKFRPDIGILLNLTPDHLDRHTSFEEYAAAKMRLFENQIDRDFAVLNADDPEVTKRMPSGPQIVLVQPAQASGTGRVPRGNQIMIRQRRFGSCCWPARRNFAAWRAQSRKCSCRLRRRASRRCSPGGYCGRGEDFSRSRASAGVCRRDWRRRILQRFEGHECGRDVESNRSISRTADRHSRRQGQRKRYTPLHEPLRRRARLVIADRRGGGKDCCASLGGGRLDRARRHARPRGARSPTERGEAGRRGAARAGMRELRPVRELRASRARFQAAGREARAASHSRMTAADPLGKDGTMPRSMQPTGNCSASRWRCA